MSPRTAGPPAARGDLGGLVAGAIALAVVVVGAAVWIPLALARPPGYRHQGLVAAPLALFSGTIRWSAACTAWALAEVVAVTTFVAALRWAWRRRSRRRGRLDHRARRMASRADTRHLNAEAVEETARRLRPSLEHQTTIDRSEIGTQLGETLIGRDPLIADAEKIIAVIAGTRAGKTTGIAIPAVVSAPGPVLATSVKGDLCDATYDVRAATGRCWVFDPQQLWQQPQTMWFNPLRNITSITDAWRLAEHFASAERPPGTQRHAFFDPKAETLCACLLLAAAVSGKPITQAYEWSTRPEDEQPARLLDAHGLDLAAKSIDGVIGLPEETRGGVYGGTEALLRVLMEPAVSCWVTPPTDPTIEEFDPTAFVASTGTLYLLSLGGPGSPAPLIAAFTDAVLLAGERRARRSRRRRLDPPLLSVLDEAANICRMRQLPNQVSWFGSLGLPILFILQSYAQGLDVWGRNGMDKLWDSANFRVYLGGIADAEWLERMSKLIGDDDVVIRSTSSTGSGWGDQTVSYTTRRQRILEPSDLTSLPMGRMILFASGTPAIFARPVPWHEGPYAEAIRRSIAHWDPDEEGTWELREVDTAAFDALTHQPTT